MTESQPSEERRRRAEAYADPYRPLPPTAAPATGTMVRAETELAPEEEPVTTGTLFLTIVLLMIIAAIWVVMYILLLGR